METKVTINTDNMTVLEVRTCWTEDEANKLLSTGKWRLLHGGAVHRDEMGYNAKPCWMMARIA